MITFNKTKFSLPRNSQVVTISAVTSDGLVRRPNSASQPQANNTRTTRRVIRRRILRTREPPIHVSTTVSRQTNQANIVKCTKIIYLAPGNLVTANGINLIKGRVERDLTLILPSQRLITCDVYREMLREHGPNSSLDIFANSSGFGILAGK